MSSIKNKIIPFHKARQKEEETIVLCHGHFNFLHPGHIRYLENASQHGNKLIVAVKGDNLVQDKGEKHFFNQDERALGVAAIQSVDQVVLLENMQLEDAVKRIKPNFLVLGKEFENELHGQISEAAKLINLQGGKTIFHAGETHYASTEFLRDNQSEIEKQQIKLFRDACGKQGFTFKDLKKALENFKKASLLVVGDTIVDQYIACDALGMSAEAPIIVTRELESKEFVGGAAIVALHVKALSSSCRFLSVVGNDTNANFVAEKLNAQKVDHELIEDSSRPTTLKIRYMIDKQKLFRVSRLKDHSLPQVVEDKFIKKLRHIAPKVQGIIVSDFVYGVVTPRILKAIHEMALKYGLMLFGDLQCSSQVGNISRFKNFDLICPTEREARIALGTHDEGIEWVANSLIKKTNTSNLIMNLGSDGFISYEVGKDSFLNRQHFPALITNPIDVSGAGDSLLAALAVGICSKTTFMKSSAIGAIMAAHAIQNIGNIPVSKKMVKIHLDEMNANLN